MPLSVKERCLTTLTAARTRPLYVRANSVVIRHQARRVHVSERLIGGPIVPLLRASQMSRSFLLLGQHYQAQTTFTDSEHHPAQT
jgi:hypothetical protein